MTGILNFQLSGTWSQKFSFIFSIFICSADDCFEDFLYRFYCLCIHKNCHASSSDKIIHCSLYFMRVISQSYVGPIVSQTVIVIASLTRLNGGRMEGNCL